MEISVLQSLIDRTSNQIANYESFIYKEKEMQKEYWMSDFELEQSRFTVSYYKSRIPKLVKIQKALKGEIAVQINKVAHKRFVEQLKKYVNQD